MNAKEQATGRLTLALKTLPEQDRNNITKVHLIWRRKPARKIVAWISPWNGSMDVYMDAFRKMNLRTMRANLLHESGHVDCYKNHPTHNELLDLFQAAKDRARKRGTVTRYTGKLVRWANAKPARNRIEAAARETYAEIYSMPPSQRARYCDQKMVTAYHAIRKARP